LLLNKKYLPALFIITIFFVSSCKENEKKAPEKVVEINTPEAAVSEAKKILGNDVQIAFTGQYDADTTKEFVAGTEINKPDKWGIQFHLFRLNKNSFDSLYTTGLLEGSFTDALVRKEKLASFNYDLIYYNSLDYYLGSGGGEVFAYLIDFNKKQTYYSHLITGDDRNISLYISENVTPEIKNFFISVFKKDFPNLKLINKDVDLD
jgi:hypothetical protein